MNLTTFSFPTRTLFGIGALRELPVNLAKLNIRRPLLVNRSRSRQTRMRYHSVAATLGANSEGKTWFLYCGVNPNPVENDVRETAAAFQNNNCDGVVGLGGGSALDVAKAARLLVKRPQLDWTRFYDEPDWSGLFPFVAIPTTAGTGSEVGRSSVITLDATNGKPSFSIRNCWPNGHPGPRVDSRPATQIDRCNRRRRPHPLHRKLYLPRLSSHVRWHRSRRYPSDRRGLATRLQKWQRHRCTRENARRRRHGCSRVSKGFGRCPFHGPSAFDDLRHASRSCERTLPRAGMKFCAARKLGLYRRVGIACGLDVIKSSDAEADQRTISFMKDLPCRSGP